MRNSLLYFIILFAGTLTLLHGSTLSSTVTSSSTCTTLVNGVCTSVVATINFVSTDTINSGSAYRIGSLAGGILLYLKGTGLSSDATASSVLIGGQTCVIDPTYTSSSQIGCRTPAMTTYGAQNILVYINGVQATCDTSTLCNFNYTVAYTPVLYSLDSVAITQNANLQFGGVFRVVNSPSSFTLKFNDNYLCDFSAFSSQTFQGHLYEFAKCAMGPLPAGYYKTQLTVAGKGLAVQSNTFYNQLASDGQIYNLTVLPQITGLSSHAGTTAGEVLTITGTGFSTIPLENQVYLEQTPCQVISSTNTSIQCSLVNPPITDQTTLRPGHPGMTLRVLPGNRTIDELIASTDITSGAGTKISLLSAETAYDNRTDNYTEIMEGFFKAPVTGGYKFMLSSFGPSQLYISTVNGTKSNLTLIAAVNTGTPFRSYYSTQETNQTSANITLQAGNYYFLQALHYAYNQEHMSIGAIVPSQTRQFNSQRRVQQFTMSGGCSLPAYTIKLIKTTSPIFFTLKANTSSPTFTSATFTYPGNISTFVDWMSSVYIPIVNVTRSQYDINGNLVYDDSLAQETRYSFVPSNSSFIGGMPVGYPTGYFSVITNVTGTILMGGFSSITMSGQTLVFPFDLPPETLRDFLLGIPGVTAPKVTRYGNCRISCQWIVEYDNSVDNTPPPTITLGGVSQLTASTNLLRSFTLKTVQDGTSNNLLFSPIPYHMLFTPETTAQITVSTRGFPASCYNSQCSYLVKEALVPTVTSFALRDKNVLDINLKDAEDLTLSGLGVTFASLGTYVASYDPVAQKLIAEVQLNSIDEPKVVAGTHIPQVLFNGSQLIKIADNVTGLVFSPNITSVSLDMDSLSSGVLSFNVYGSGFGYDLENSFGQIVTVDGITCEMVTLSNSQTYCTLYQPTDTGLVAVNVNAMSTNYAFNLERALNPLEITGQVLDPTTGEITITLNGTGFDNTTIVNLVNNKTNDTITCYVCSVTNLTIVCSTTGLPPGDYNIVTTTFDTVDTLSQLRTTMSVQLEIYSIEPSAGSQLGGTVITITGKGFSSIVNDNQVSLGYMLQTCDVFDANDTYIKCTIGANDNGYYEPQTVYVLQRLQFVADCKGNCTYLFSNDYTPTITDVSNTTIVSGDQLTLYGTNLTMNTQVYIGGVLAQVISANDSEIVVQVPEISAGTAINVTAYDPVYGNVDVLDTISLNYTLQVLDYSPVNGSTVGTVLTITGKGFSSSATVTVAGKTCPVLTVNTTVLTCKIGNYRGTVLVTQDGTQISPNNNVNFTTASSFTPVITTVVGLPVTQAASQLNVTLKGSYLNIAQPVQIALTSGSISYSGEILSISSSQIQAMFTLVPSGNYTLSAQIGPYYPKFNNASNTSVIIPITVNSVMPISSSYAGGLSLYVQGSGFSDNLNTFSIKIEGFNCTIQSVTFNTIVCKIPPLISDQTQPLYGFGQEQILVGTYFSAGTSENPFLAFDNSTVSYFKPSSSITDCSFGIDVGEGLIAQVMQIQYYPKSGLSDLTTLSGSVFEGSVDGVNYANLYTIDNHAYGGWNSINPPVPAGNVSGFRYIRYRRNNATDKCDIAEVSVTGILLSAIHSSDPTVVHASAKIQVNGVSLTLPNVVQYRADKTPIVTSVSPTVGTYKGNTNLTIYGTNLNQTSKVKIDNLICDIISVSDTQVICKTRPVVDLTSNRIQGNITVFVEGSGKAVTTGVNYMYAEKWSDKDTWGCGGFPREGDSVYVTTGMNLILDVSPPKLVALIIEGALIFQDTDITLVAEYILIRNGFLQIGTESEPIQSNINITLYGTKSDEQLPIFGNKMIGLYEGTVDIHGKPRTVSTKLNVTGSPGQSVIHVQGPVDWKAGDRIAISSTSYDPTQTEQKTIVSVTGNSIQLDSALKYTHLVRLTPPVEGQVYEIRAEVVLLSRNVIIQGDYSSERLNYGAHMLFYDPGTESTIVRLSYIEVTSAGQTGYLGRFPVHFQHAGNQFRSYVIGCSIHHTYQRGIQLQGTSYLTIQKNLVFAVQGYGINLENGVERFNIFEDNIAINGQTTVQYLTTQESPIGYRISSPTNFFRRNKALCNPSYGFWFDLQAYAAGAYSTTTICPNGEVLGAFEDNVAAWNVNDGIRFDTYQPRTYPCRQAQYTNQVDPFAANPPVKAIFKDIMVIGNANKGVEGVNVGTIIFDGLTAIDNAIAGFDFIFADASPINGTVVSNSVFIGSTYIETATTAYRGLRTCRSESCFLDNILFVNYTTTHPALESDAYTTSSSSTDSGARTIFLQALRFINVTVRTMFSHASAHMFKDLDGSLTGITTGATVVNNMPHLQGLPGCTANTATYGGLVCNTTTVLKKIVFYSVASSNLLSQPLKVLRLNSSLSENNRSASDYSSVAYKYGRNPTSSYAIPFALGYSYKVFFNNSLDWTSLTYELSVHSVAEDAPMTLVFNYTAPRETFVFTKYGRLYGTVPVSNLTELWNIYSIIGSRGKMLGDWYMDADAGRLYVAMIGGNGTKVASVGYQCLYTCPIPGNGSNDTLPKMSYYWSDNTIWPNETLPQEGDSITIPSNWVLTMDINPPALNYLEIQGELKFDDTNSTREENILMAKKIWVRGKLTAGTSLDQRFGQKATIMLIGTRDETSLLVNGNVEIGTKALAVTGQLLLYGQEVTEKFTLLESLYPGDTVIKTNRNLTGWEPGHLIALTTSRNEDAAYEIVQIASISDSNITLTTGVQYFHYSGVYTQQADNLVYNVDYSAEVILLNRSITIQGSREDNWGARVVVTEESNGYVALTGRADIQSVAFDYCGQYLQYSALSFETMNNVSAGVYSILNSSVITNSLAWGIKFSETNNVKLMNTTILGARQFGVFFYAGSINVEVTGNRFIGVVQDSNAITLEGISAGLYIDDITYSTVIIQDNIASGCDTGFIIQAPSCDDDTSPYAGNIAHTSNYGFLVLSTYGQCAEIADLTAYRTVYGVFSYFGASNILARNLVLTDNNISININAVGDDTVNQTLVIQDSFFAAYALVNCTECYAFEDDCINRTAIMLGTATSEGKSVPNGPYDLPYAGINSYANVNANQTFTNNTFVNFQDGILPQCGQNYVFRTNAYASDYTPPVSVSASHLVNVTQNNLVYFVFPVPEQRCGNIPCTGLQNVLIKDIDGTLLGTKGEIIPSNTGVINTTTCTFIQSNNGFYICKDQRLAILGFESLDNDKTTRIISPAVVSNSNGFTNSINAFKAHDMTDTATELTRLARFLGLFQKNGTYNVKFSGTLPSQLQFEIEGATKYDYAILTVFYFEPIVVTVYNALTNSYISPVVSEFATLASIKTTDPCGTNYYDRDANTLNFKLTADPNCKVFLQRTSVLAVNVRYDMSQADFYEQGGAARFVDKVASILGISLSTIRVVSIVSGSVILNVELIATQQAQQYLNETKVQLGNFTTQLQQAIVNGDLNVYGAPILNYGFESIYAYEVDSTAPKDPIESSTNTILGESTLILFIAVGGAVIVVALGIYCVWRYRKRRINSKSVVRVSPPTIQTKPIHAGRGFKKVAPDTMRATSPREDGTIIDITSKAETPLGIKKQGSMDHLLSRNGLSFNDLNDRTRALYRQQSSIAQIPTTLTIDDLSKTGSSPTRSLQKVWTPLRPKAVEACSINLDEEK